MPPGSFFLFALPPRWVLLVSPLSRRSPVFSGLVAVLPSHRHFEVAPIPTLRAVAHGGGYGCGGGGCWSVLVGLSSCSRRQRVYLVAKKVC